MLLAAISSGGTSLCRDTFARASVTRQGTTAGWVGRRYTSSKWMAEGTKRLSLSVLEDKNVVSAGRHGSDRCCHNFTPAANVEVVLTFQEFSEHYSII